MHSSPEASVCVTQWEGLTGIMDICLLGALCPWPPCPDTELFSLRRGLGRAQPVGSEHVWRGGRAAGPKSGCSGRLVGRAALPAVCEGPVTRQASVLSSVSWLVLKWVLRARRLGPLGPSPSLPGPGTLCGLFHQSSTLSPPGDRWKPHRDGPGGLITKEGKGLGRPCWSV